MIDLLNKLKILVSAEANMCNIQGYRKGLLLLHPIFRTAFSLLLVVVFLFIFTETMHNSVKIFTVGIPMLMWMMIRRNIGHHCPNQ